MQRRHLAPFVVAFALLLPAIAAQAEEKGWFGLAFHGDIGNGPRSSLKVEKVVPGSPAANAGITAGDSILEVEGISIAKATVEALGAAMKKSVGETLHLKIKRASGEVRMISLVAAPVPDQ